MATAAVGTTEELDNAELYEIIDGVRVEMPPMSAESSLLASQLAARINLRTMPENLGAAHAEILIRLPLPIDRNRRHSRRRSAGEVA